MIDEGVGAVVATPIMRWLSRGSRTDRRVQPDHAGAGPAGAIETDVLVVLQALLDRHGALRLRVLDGADPADPRARAPSMHADCLHTVGTR